MTKATGSTAAGRVGPDAGDALTVRYVDAETVVPEGGSLEFGRAGDLVIDSNPLLHRRLGRVVRSGGTWWVENVGSVIPLRVACESTGGFSLVPPGTRVALTARVSRVSFGAGSARYELTLVRSAADDDLVPVGVPPDGTTTRAAELPLNTDQRLLLVVLCEARLRDPASPLVLPTNREVAARLGWSESKLNRKLDWLCERYARAGVAGLKVRGGRARFRRRRLIEYALDSGLVGPDDLALLN